MKVIYLFFFLLINLLIFEKLTKKMEIKTKLKIGITITLFIIAILHFVDPFGFAIENKLFLILFGFSLSLFVFHYGSRIAIAFSTAINKGQNDKLLYNWYNILIFYVVYKMISVFQVATLIKNWS